ncbi:hypothetical protein D3C71_2034630 [compost metagenome]
MPQQSGRAADNSQTQPQAFTTVTLWIVELVEFPEDPLLFGRGDSRPVVPDLDA